MLDQTNQKTALSGQELRARQTKKCATLSLGMSLLLTGGAAFATPVDFSFTDGGGFTVTGEIDGLSFNGNNQTASMVYVDSATGDSIPGPMLFQTNVTANLFSVSNGTITDATFAASNAALTYRLDLNIPGPTPGSAAVNLFGSSHGVIFNQDGFTGASYTNVPAPVPELPIPLMLSAGMLVPILARRARKLRTA